MQAENLAQAANLIWGFDPKVIATAIVVVCYIILFTEKLNRAVVALLGACVMIFSGILTQATALQGIDFNTISLLVGMMTIVGISEKSGMFQYVAIWGVQRVKANPRGLLLVLAVVTAVFSAFLDNVTTVLLIAPVTFKITQKLNINPYPYLLLEIFASNIGGTATLIGDPPNILIGSSLNLSFMDFVKELTPVVVITMAVLILAFDLVYHKRIQTTLRHQVEVMKIRVDWTTIFFFSGLFVIVYGLEETGVLKMLGQMFVDFTDGSIKKATLLIVWTSAILSSAIDNIPFVATMIPMIKSMEVDMGGREAMMPVWWALSLGACFGGNGTLIGASANVIVAGMAQREGHPIHFMRFLLWSIPVMLGSVALATAYLYIQYF